MVKKRDEKAQNSEAEAAEGPRFIHNSQSKWTTANTPAGEGPGSRGPRTTPGAGVGLPLSLIIGTGLEGPARPADRGHSRG